MDDYRLTETRFRLTALLDEDPGFRQEWHEAVQRAADIATAEVTHQRGNGHKRGMAEVSFVLPVPVGWDIEAVGDLFGEAALAEAERRLESMCGKGLL